ncbi:tRNA (adenosine(37)-N6)-threonylcarbamoyltransferase complex ATPase subunit type 1 TsaE [Candidatus Saccharibacteria bacterium]|nr:tRNA (adenosine(37)-N6)-threonylcarbamoyltransferase complex ATPase subunit type 1 TsaE [Candidatus Saccharibacteria bacterium]MBP9131638.1 tRNA (adenosine(37)-N6)-threonylcarbamoyltransferase complex ATPase subunit type 1 TsaE [Candidatus Saccharibacteria bacterium]
MSSVTTLEITSKRPEDTSALGQRLAEILKTSDVRFIELIGDLGTGKTQLVRGLARGINSQDVVQSPSFTISRQYNGNDITIHHYDLYRLGDEPGIIQSELQESIDDPKVITVIEWADSVIGFLPKNRIKIIISHHKDEQSRNIKIRADAHLVEMIR